MTPRFPFYKLQVRDPSRLTTCIVQFTVGGARYQVCGVLAVIVSASEALAEVGRGRGGAVEC